MPEDRTWNLFITGSLFEPHPTEPGARVRVVYQRVGRKFGNIHTPGGKAQQKRAHVIPYDPRTPYQIALRARFAAATAAWHAADEPTRQDYRDRAAHLTHTGFNQFVSDWTRAHPLNPADFSAVDQTFTLVGPLAIHPNAAKIGAPTSAKTRLNLARL